MACATRSTPTVRQRRNIRRCLSSQGLTRNTGGPHGQTNGSTDLGQGRGCRRGAAALGLFPASAEAGGTPQTTSGELSLYDRLGGYFGIAAVVDRFSDEIIKNPILKKNPAIKAWNKTQAEAWLPGLKFGRTLWIAAAAGGPFVYTGLPLSEAHAEFHLTAEQFAEVGAEIVRALDYYQVPEREQQELVTAYRASMSDVVTANG